MILALLLQTIFSIHSFDVKSSSSVPYNTAINEVECIYGKNISQSIIADDAVCLIHCSFISLKTTQEGGAVFISLNNKYNKNIVFKNCTFTECLSKRGGSIFINGTKICSIQIINSTFKSNSASLTGGAIYITSEMKNNLEIENCSFISNSALYYSGSIYGKYVNYSIENSEFKNNSIKSSKLTEGAAIFSSNSYAIIIDCRFTNNIAISDIYHSYGGAISFFKTNGLFSNCSFVSNIAYTNSSEIYGGAIYILDSYEKFEKCIFTDNIAYKGSNSIYYKTYGGAIFFTNSEGNFIKCTFINNSAYSKSYRSYGGAISFLGKNGSFKKCL